MLLNYAVDSAELDQGGPARNHLESAKKLAQENDLQIDPKQLQQLQLQVDNAKVEEVEELDPALFKKGLGMTIEEAKKLMVKNINSSLGRKDAHLQVSDIQIQAGEEPGQILCSIENVGVVDSMAVVFDLNTGVADLQLAEINNKAQGQNLMKGFFKGLLTFVQKAPKGAIQQMTMTANLTVGGYSWARSGFYPKDKANFDFIAGRSIEIMERYLSEVQTDSKNAKKERDSVRRLVNRLKVEVQKKEPDTKLIRQIAGLTLEIPEKQIEGSE